MSAISAQLPGLQVVLPLLGAIIAAFIRRGALAWAFDTRTNPFGQRLRAMFSSDMGHWDVPDMTGILPEAFERVEKGLLSEADFREFVCTNPLRFYTSANPRFFEGTRVAEAAAKLLAGEAEA